MWRRSHLHAVQAEGVPTLHGHVIRPPTSYDTKHALITLERSCREMRGKWRR